MTDNRLLSAYHLRDSTGRSPICHFVICHFFFGLPDALGRYLDIGASIDPARAGRGLPHSIPFRITCNTSGCR